MIAYMASMPSEPSGIGVSMIGSIRLPCLPAVVVISGSMSDPRMVVDADTYRLSAKKMLSVPSVTMKGGSRSRVMRRPFRRPQAVPKAKPMSRAATPGTP